MGYTWMDIMRNCDLHLNSRALNTTSLYHKNQDDLEDQISRDRKKREICVREGIDLIIIPYSCDLLPYIKSELQKKGYLSHKE